MAPSIFIAVQCCQCSTMQVKQQKKSSNKWSCVVCNQKQSLRKVFAQGFMAKDVRKFVQNFNMSRQCLEQSVDQTLVSVPEDAANRPSPGDYKRKRTDWSEYIDLEDNYDDRIADDREDVLEHKIVTESPKALFKQPKLSAYSSGLGTEDGDKGFKPVFSKRNSNRPVVSLDRKPRNCQPTVNGTLKWSDYKAQNEDLNCVDKERRNSPPSVNGTLKWRIHMTQEDRDSRMKPMLCQSSSAKVTSEWCGCITADNSQGRADYYQPGTIKGASKWDSYITKDDDEWELEGRRGFADHRGLGDGEFEAMPYDERVEDDIHPDFL
ncbi:uncharacterized protein LOC127808341 [Diospyros lotus]|uniref:uncharacterized protein LOC127808341 n=1 Tax=Diospyros lotus TaxID=55363 RepID=UPI002258244A|nr:uncharacterized protein LOC127808341 [Diospyros lotus]